MEHNELTRVQLPAAVHLTRLGYTYIKKKELRQDKDEETNILINRFRSAFLSLNSDANQEDFDNVFKNIKVELAQDDLGKSFFERLLVW